MIDFEIPGDLEDVRRRVAEFATLSDIAEQPAHDLARPGLGQVVGEDDRLRAADLADLGGDVVAELFAELVGHFGGALDGDESDDRLSGQVVLGADHRGLRDLGVVDERRLHLGRGDAVT